MQIKTKAESVTLYEQGFFGNKGLTWETVQDYYTSDYEGFVVLRYKDRSRGGGPCIYNLKGWYEVYQAVRHEIEVNGFEESKMWINAQMPDHAIAVQGEYWVAQDYTDGAPGTRPIVTDMFRCSEAKLQMRDAVRDVHYHVSGYAAKELLRRRMCPRSWANFQWLLDAFPGHIIEVSVYDQAVGLQGWNSVVWEVRSY
jgi:hypothetical protein